MRLTRLLTVLAVSTALTAASLAARADGLIPRGTTSLGLCYATGSTGVLVPCVLGGTTWTRVYKPGDDLSVASVTATGAVSAPSLALTGTGSTGDVSGMSVLGRSLQARAQDVVNVKDAPFNATCNGTGNDQPAIQAALDAAAARKSPLVILPEGQCVLNAGLTLTVPMTVQGAGMSAGPGAVDTGHGTVLVANFAAGDVIYARSLYGFTFRDFQINSNVGKRTSGSGIHIDVSAGGSGNGASRVERVATNNQFTGVRCTSCLLFEMVGTYHQAWTRSAYLADGTAANESSGGYLHHNWFEGDSTSTTTQVAGIESHVGYIRISHNLFVGAQYPIQLRYDTRPAGSTVIVDNTIENPVIDAISIANAAGIAANNMQISRNEFMLTGGDTGTYAVNHIHILANAGGTGSWISNLQVNENTLVGQFTAAGPSAYFNVSSGTNVSITDNTVTHLGGDTAYTFIVGAEATNVLARDNKETGTSTGPRYFIGTSSMQVIDRQGLPFASLPSGAANGSEIYVTDGLVGSSPFAGGGTGAAAIRINAAWVTATLAQGVWTTFTPTLAANTGSVTTRGASASRYLIEGKRVTLTYDETITTDGTSGASYLILGLPSGVVPKARARMFGFDAANSVDLLFSVNGGTSTVNAFKQPTTGSLAYPGANGTAIVGTLVFEMQ